MTEEAAIRLAIKALKVEKRKMAPLMNMYRGAGWPYHEKYDDEYKRYEEAIQILENKLVKG